MHVPAVGRRRGDPNSHLRDNAKHVGAAALRENLAGCFRTGSIKRDCKWRSSTAPEVNVAKHSMGVPRGGRNHFERSSGWVCDEAAHKNGSADPGIDPDGWIPRVNVPFVDSTKSQIGLDAQP